MSVRIEMLVDGSEFWPRLQADLRGARESVVAQALSFEGDQAGLGMAEALASCRARDRRLMIDGFTRHVVSDRFVWSPRNLLDPELRAEVRATGCMIDGLRAAGVGVRFTNPAGPLFLRAPRRNHKKLVVVDERVAYIGGINFADHNFAWHDLMLRIEDPGVARFLSEDFAHSWDGGGHRASRRAFDGLALTVLDGACNHEAFAPVLELLAGARESVFVECPYLTPPFCEPLAAARRRGVAVTVVTPAENNWQLAHDTMVWQAQEHGLDVRFYPGRMTHMKAMLVDGRSLVLGSANFDVWSWRFQQEFLAVVSDPDLIDTFRARVLEPDLRQSLPCDVRLTRGAMRVLEWKLAALQALA